MAVDGAAGSAAPSSRPAAIIAAGILGFTLLLAGSGAPGIPCLFKSLTHLPCPGCGITRSLQAMWAGDPVRSLRYHLLGPAVFIGCLVVLCAAVRGRSLWLPIRAWLGILAALLLAYFLKLADLFSGSGILLS